MNWTTGTSAVAARWALRLGSSVQSNGCLELRRCEGAYFWSWTDKPTHLVPLTGVQDEQGSKPWGFSDMDSAIGHLMNNVGFAFRGDCGLEQLH